MLQSLCHGNAQKARHSIPRTIGCRTDVSTHVVNGTRYSVEWLEVGGSNQYRDGRQKVYELPFDGMLIVFDSFSDRAATAVPACISDVSRAMPLRLPKGGGDSDPGATTNSRQALDPAGSGTEMRHRGAGLGRAGGARGAGDPAGSIERSPYNVTKALKELPMLLIANKTDTAPAPKSMRSRRGSGLLSPPEGRSSRIKLDVVLAPTESYDTFCGCSCRRPKKHHVSLDVAVAPAVS